MIYLAQIGKMNITSTVLQADDSSSSINRNCEIAMIKENFSALFH